MKKRVVCHMLPALGKKRFVVYARKSQLKLLHKPAVAKGPSHLPPPRDLLGGWNMRLSFLSSFNDCSYFDLSLRFRVPAGTACHPTPLHPVYPSSKSDGAT